MSAAVEVCALPSDHSKTLIDSIAKGLDFADFKLHVSLASAKGDNYLGEVYRIKITGKKGNSNENTDLSLILKTSPSDVAMRQFMPINKMYRREIYAYENILPVLDGLQREFKILSGDRFNHAKCYKGCSDDLKELLVLEDLGIQGFKMFDRLKEVDYDHTVLIIRKLAAFHATSFVLKERDPKKFASLASNICNSVDFGANFPKFLEDTVERMVGLMDDQECADKLKAVGVDVNEKMEKSLSIGEPEPHAILCHGDCWSNNFLFKYKDDKPIDMVMLDWQIMRHSSPVTDLAYYFFSCTDESFRTQHFSQILDIYYETLSKRINNLGQKAERLFPEKVFRAHVKKYLIYGLIMSMVIIPLTQSERGDAPDLTEILNNENAPPPPAKLTEQGLKRIRGVVRDFIKYKMI